jgi:fatty acid CoA ligase FadD9
MVQASAARSNYPQNVFALMEQDRGLAALVPAGDLFTAGASPTFQEALDIVFAAYADRPALGHRAYKVSPDADTGSASRHLQPNFDTLTYRQLRDRVRHLATAWRRHPRHRVHPGDFVCLLGFTSVDLTVLFFGCAYAQAVSVPLQTTLGDDLSRVFTTTEPTCVAATIDDLVAAARLAVENSSIRSVVAFDYDPDVASEHAQFDTARDIMRSCATAELITLDDLLAEGAAHAWEPLPPAPERQERTALLIHSSGSTGTPKGAIYSDRLAMRPMFTGTISSGGKLIPVVRMALAPMNHLMGQTHVLNTMGRGGTIYFTAKSDLSTLFEDIRLARPTELSMFPRIMDIIYAYYAGEVARRSGHGGAIDAIRAQVMSEMRAGFLGDRLCAVVTGSAPLAPEVRQFIVDCFQVPFSEGYGLTETGSVLLNGRITRPPILDYKLRDVPELGYYTSDTPYPRGELLVKTEIGISGYFKAPDATARLLDADGYYRTGDIMAEHDSDYLIYVDRVNDVLKLSQGEFVAIGAIGVLFENHCPSIMQMYAYANSARPYILAVIVPNMEVARGQLGPDPDDEAVRALLRAEMKNAAEEHDLKAFEVPRDFIVEYEPFSFENGLLTSIRKRRRQTLKARYGEELEALYAAQEQRQDEELRSLRNNDALSTEEKLTIALEAALGIEHGGVGLTQSFSELGGDSLGTTGFAIVINEIFDVDLSVNAILTPAGNVLNWARAIDAARLGGFSGLPSYANLHGADATALHASDLDLSAFLDAEVLKREAPDPPVTLSRHVLLTGATGYLGRFLCLEWLELLDAHDGKLVCLIRAADETAALQRLAARFATDPVLAERFTALAGRRLEILIGDIAQPYLGLSKGAYDRLAAETDHIVHCGALVNHVLPYSKLFEPNVVGTAQLIQLALTHRKKRFDFVSTIAVCSLLQPGQSITETTSLLQDIALKGSYAEGYACSKWASEHLLHSANERFGLPVNIFRCDMILADRRYAGQLNVADTLTRLLGSIVITGSAPESFYPLTPDGSPQPCHYDGLPVDFVSAAIVGIGNLPNGNQPRTLHVRNHNVDAHVSLDTFVDWIEEAGYCIEREPEYKTWLAIFKRRLEELPESQRARSVLPILNSVQKPQQAFRPIDSELFRRAVGQLPMRNVPPLDRALLDKYLKDLQSLDLIPPPGLLQAVALGTT